MGIGDEVRARRAGFQISTERFFSNREAEQALFDSKLEELRATRVSNPGWSDDLTGPRHNVLVFHAYGGIGKDPPQS